MLKINLATNTLTYQDLNDFYREETKGYNFGTSVGGNTDKGKANMAPNGSTTIGLTHTGQEKEQITRATIGNGSIVIANNKDISDLNRDVDKSQEITKDIITGALNGSMTIDNRVFTSDGRSSIANDFKNLGSNLHTLYKDITKNNIIVQSVKNAVTDKDKNIIDAVKDYIGDSKKIDQIRKDKETTNNLNGMTNLDAERVRNTMQSVVDVASQDGGFNGNVNLYNIDGQTRGYAYSDGTDNNIIGFNTNANDLTNSNSIINVLFHETTNQEEHSANERTALNRGNTAEAIWDMKNYANTNTNRMTSQQWNQNNASSPVLTQGNTNRINNYSNYYQENIQNGNKNVKLDELTVFVHGTFSNPDTFTPEFRESIKTLTGDEKQDDIKWSGDNTKQARAEAANKISNLINNYEFAENEPLIFVAHSHGGNVVKEYSNMVGDDGIVGANGTKPSMTAVYNFATPNRSDYIMKDGVFDKYYNIYNVNDVLTQDVFGGTDLKSISNLPILRNIGILDSIPLINYDIIPWSFKNPSQTTNEAGAINIPVNQDYTNYNNSYNNFIENLNNADGNIFYKLYFDVKKDQINGQINNHTDMKNPETVNEIYNQEAIRIREIENNLKMYENFINIINKNK